MSQTSNRSHQIDDEPVPGFRLVRFLGRGASGEVWEAIGPGGVRSALKIVYLSGALALKELSALRLVKSVQHPHLVPLFGYWLKDAQGQLVSDANSQIPSNTGTMKVTSDSVLDGTLYVAMGMCDQDLMQRLKECQREGLSGIPVDELLGYMEESAKALDWLNGQKGATRAGLQHCDIKPSNIMLLAGSIQVCDYGLIRVATDVRATKGAFGTVAYAAPECIRDQNANASPHTDQYSLAVSYIELRTGKLPYDSNEFWGVLERVRAGRLTYPPELTPAELAVVRKALSIDPDDRFPSIAAFAKELRHALQNPSSVVPGRGWGSIRTRVFAVIALLAGMSIGGVLYFDRIKNQDDQIAVKEKANGPPTPAELAQPTIEQAQAFYDQRRYDESLAACEVALKLDLASQAARTLRVHAWRARGRERLAKNEYPTAIADFSAAHEQDPTDATVLTARAEAHAAQQHWPDAITDLTASLAIHKNSDALTQRGITYLSLADTITDKSEASAAVHKAIEDFTAAIQIDRESASGYSLRGIARLRLEQFAEAIADLTAAIRFDPDHAVESHSARAVAEHATGRSDLAALDEQLAQQLTLLEQMPGDVAVQTKLKELREKFQAAALSK